MLRKSIFSSAHLYAIIVLCAAIIYHFFFGRIFNISNVQHCLGFTLFALFYLEKIDYRIFFAVMGIAIEVDQALEYGNPWYGWFISRQGLETFTDLFSNAYGVWFAVIILIMFSKKNAETKKN